eukprot:1596561-Pleurochrysis_carterae.AAC.1
MTTAPSSACARMLLQAAYRATRRAWLQVRNKKQTPSEASESVGTSRSDRLTNVAADDEADFLILGQQERRHALA